MTKRRLAMEKLLGGEGEDEAAAAPPPSRAGAVRSMGLALDRLHAAAQSAAQSAAESVAESAVEPAEGGRVVELDPALCDPSFVRDRIEDEADDGIDELARSIAEGGQAVPVLVRPSPAAPGRFQIAYGHRRWRACQRLGRPLRAVVRELGDDDLVLVQGHENNARRDLTFIERAQFAHALVARGFSRAVAGKALGVDKSELARLLQVAGGLPEGLAAAIGRAPKAGRPRWLRLVALCGAGGGAGGEAEGRAAAFAALEAVRERPSDVRFAAVLSGLAKAAAVPHPPVPLPAEVKVGRRRTLVTIDETAAPGFGGFVEARLPALFREFRGKA